MANAQFRVGDVFDRLAEIPDGSVDLILTSPPFLALRSYLPSDHPLKGKEIGSEPTPAAFLDTLLALTAEWRRVLAPHGSICVELGDTYSGSGGAGGDYSDEGLRAEQPRFDGSAKRTRASGARTEDESRMGVDARNRARRGGNAATIRQNPDAWPLAKSLCGIPHLYHLSLAYGRNLLTGEASPAGQWRVRNVVAWVRPNPPVGALGDKFRPATSYMTVACVSGSRYFDLDAVRTEHKSDPTAYRGNGYSKGSPEGVPGNESMPGNPAGAPPLDWWEIPTAPYKGSHYATWPPALCTRPILAMCPAFVCMDCGLALGSTHDSPRTMPGVREPDHEQVGDQERAESNSVLFQDLREPGHGPQPIVHEGVGQGSEGLHPDSLSEAPNGHTRGLRNGAQARHGESVGPESAAERGGTPHQRGQGRQPSGESRSPRQARPRPEAEAPGLAHNDVPSLWRADSSSQPCPRCSGGLRLGRVLDPFAGSGTTLAVATGHGRDAIGIDLDARNADLARERVGMFLEVDYGTTEAAS